jgi:hypothetical protein
MSWIKSMQEHIETKMHSGLKITTKHGSLMHDVACIARVKIPDESVEAQYIVDIGPCKGSVPTKMQTIYKTSNLMPNN